MLQESLLCSLQDEVDLLLGPFSPPAEGLGSRRLLCALLRAEVHSRPGGPGLPRSLPEAAVEAADPRTPLRQDKPDLDYPREVGSEAEVKLLPGAEEQHLQQLDPAICRSYWLGAVAR